MTKNQLQMILQVAHSGFKWKRDKNVCEKYGLVVRGFGLEKFFRRRVVVATTFGNIFICNVA